MFLTEPEEEETLNRFYRKVRPGGPGWWKQRIVTGLTSAQDLTGSVQKVIASILLLYGVMLGSGGFLLLQETTGWSCLVIAVIGGWWLRKLNKRRRIISIPRPGLSDPDEDEEDKDNS